MQFGYLALLLAVGGAMGAVFDIYNTLTAANRWLRRLRSILDIVFWCLSAIVVFYITYFTDDGRFRLYTFALVLVGYGLYRLLFHSAVVKSAAAFAWVVGRLFHVIMVVLRVLIFTPLAMLWSVLRSILVHVYKFLCLVENGVVWVVGLALTVVSFPFRPLWHYFGKQVFDKIAANWEGMYHRMSNWLRARLQ